MNALLSTILAAEQQSGGLASLLPMILLVGGLVYFMTASSRKQKKKQAEMMSSLKVGDEVVTSGGIWGTVNYLEDQVAHVSIDTDVVIRVNKTALTRMTPVDADDDDAVDESPADAADDAEIAEATAIDVTTSGDDEPTTDTGRPARARKR